MRQGFEKKNEYTVMKQMFKMILVVCLMISAFIETRCMDVQAASTTSRLPIICYTLSDGNVNTYDAVNGRRIGYIAPSDQNQILQVYSSGWVKVKYPVGKNKYRTAYAQSKYFFVDVNFSTSTVKAGTNRKVYKKANLAAQLGTVYGTDTVIKTGTKNGRDQIIYKISGGYKMGFISGTIQQNTTNKTNTNTNATNGLVTLSEIERFCFDYRYYADTYPDLKAAFGYNEQQLYNHWRNRGILEGRGASPVLDLTYYMAKNPDLQRAFGKQNYTRAYTHFINNGVHEYRKSSKYYDGNYYRGRNTDLKSMNSLSLIRHYVQYGRNEGRYANTMRYFTANTNTSTVQNNTNSLKWEMPMQNAYCTWKSFTNMSWASYTNRSGNRDYHLGLDIYGTNGIVRAAANGKVVKANSSAQGANGRYVIIQHNVGGKIVYSFYAHLARITVSQGAQVSVGTQIGVAGGSGYGKNQYYGTHLHFAIVDTLWSSGGYYGYAPKFTGNKVKYSNVTYYNPKYVIEYDMLP